MNTTDDQCPDLLGSVTGCAQQRWSAEQPSAAGWWWVDQPEVPVRAIIKVKIVDGVPYAFAPAHDEWVECSRFNAGARWAGPLPEPLDASDAETGHNRGTLRRRPISGAFDPKDMNYLKCPYCKKDTRDDLPHCDWCLCTFPTEAERPNGSAFASSDWLGEVEAELRRVKARREDAERRRELEYARYDFGVESGLRYTLAAMRSPSPNDHKLSDCGAWRGSCEGGGKAVEA